MHLILPLTKTIPCLLFIAISFLFFSLSLSYSCTFTITNNCPHTIWPGTLAGSGTPQLPTTGFQLDSGQSVRIPSVPGWSGRIWARTGCSFDQSGIGKCQTGDCGGKLQCGGNGATPPASLFEITLGKGTTDKDFYDVSLVDGYNLPLVASPHGVLGGACNATGCASEINTGCPKELQVVGGDGGGGVVACKSACEAFGLDQYCCSGEFGNPTTCRPSIYSTIFKRACPRAYSYAYDDGTSTFTCKASEYSLVFCPKVNGIRQPDSTLLPPTIQEPPPTPTFQEQPPPTPIYQEPPATPIFQQPPPTPTVQEPPPTPAFQEPPPTPPTFQEPPPTPIYQEPPATPTFQQPPPTPTFQEPPPTPTFQQPPPTSTPTFQQPPPTPTISFAHRREEDMAKVSSSSMLLPVPTLFILLILNVIS